jgi:hypothetical protein
MDHILGVDASSTVVGYCIINSNEELIKTDCIKFHKDLNIIEKSLVLRQHLDVMDGVVQTTNPLKSFGMSTEVRLTQMQHFTWLIWQDMVPHQHL